MKLWSALKALHSDLEARLSRYFRTQEIIKVLSAKHMQELAATPGEQWALLKSRHVQEIRAVRDGKFDIVDRRSWAYPYLPEALHRLNQPVLKNTPYNLRKFSETPIPRKAINLIKNAVCSLKWKVGLTEEAGETNPDREMRIKVATECLKRPNNVDSFRTLMEAVTEDICIGGYGCIEPRMTLSAKRPFKLWAVDGSTIRLFMDWTEGEPDKLRYAQMSGLKGERGVVGFRADELLYLKLNNRSNTPFGLGQLEVAFQTVLHFLGVQDMAGKAGSDQIHKTFLWWENPQAPAHLQTLRRYITNEGEGQAKLNVMAGMKKPEVIEVTPVTEADLLLNWQEFLIRIIAAAFDISPMSLGLERDVNRATGQVLADADFRAAVIPMATRIQEEITRSLLHGFMGWKDLEFTFIGLEDLDALTRSRLQQTEYGMDALLPDEIREEQGRPPLPGGWGQLTRTQASILAQSAATRAQQQAQKNMPPGIPGLPGTGPAGGMRPPGLPPMGGFNNIPQNIGDTFSARDVAEMTPDEVMNNQKMGLLPEDNNVLKDQMEKEEPGILETLSEDLADFLEKRDKEEKKSVVKPSKVSVKDEKEQQVRFTERNRPPTEYEKRHADPRRTSKLIKKSPGNEERAR